METCMMPSSFAQTSRGPLGRFSGLRLRLTGCRGSKKSGRSRPRLEALEERFLPAVSVLQNFAGINSNQNAFLLTPPDNMMAVGPTAVVASVNTAITLTNKSGGGRVGPFDFSAFYAAIYTLGDGFTDPYLLYDDQAGRFYAGIIEFDPNSGIASLDFAVSKTSAPATLGAADWSVFKIGAVNENG